MMDPSMTAVRRPLLLKRRHLSCPRMESLIMGTDLTDMTQRNCEKGDSIFAGSRAEGGAAQITVGMGVACSRLWSVCRDADREIKNEERGVRDSPSEFEGMVEASGKVSEMGEEAAPMQA